MPDIRRKCPRCQQRAVARFEILYDRFLCRSCVADVEHGAAIDPVPVGGLAFRRDAFALAMAPLEAQETGPPKKLVIQLPSADDPVWETH